MNRSIQALLIFFCAVALLAAQEPPTDTPQTPPNAGSPQRGAGAPPTPEPQPYDKVITKEAKTQTGIFTVHQIKDKYYYEIPKGEFDKQFLWVSQIAKTTLGVGYGGQMLGSRIRRPT